MKNSILLLLLLFTYVKSQSQEFSKSFDFGNSFTRFVSSVRSNDSNRDGQIIVGITREAPNSTFNDILITKIDLNGNINYAQVVDMPGTNENAYCIINDNNPNNLNGFVLLCSSTRFSNAGEQDIMIITLSADLAFRPGLSFIYENNTNTDKFDYGSNIY